MKKMITFLSQVIENRYIIKQLTIRNVTLRYKSSKMGMFWSLGEPLAFVGILYFVFGFGLKAGRLMDMPFICYLISGMSVANFFTQTLVRGSTEIRAHQYLLKKVNFNLSLLPLITVLTNIVDHLIFMVPVLAVFLINGIMPAFSWFQIFYYMGCLALLLLGITWFTSSVGVFIPDLQNIVGILGQMFFYATPIFWTTSNFSPEILRILKLNPLYYIANGYRESLYYGIPFWKHPIQTLYFWGCILIMMFVGTFFFRKLKPQFADYV